MPVSEGRFPTGPEPGAAAAARQGRLRGLLVKHRVAASTVLGVLTLLVTFGVWRFPSPTPELEFVIVPTVIGTELETARASILERGLVPHLIEGDEERDGPVVVLQQDPAGGTRARTGSQVTLSFSRASTLVAVPDIVGMQEAAAREVLDELGLVLEVTAQEEDDTVPVGQVLAQQPPAGRDTSVGANVTVTLSKAGPPVARPVLVAVTVTPRGGFVAVVDITVRNDGGQLAVLTGVEFTITGHQSAPPSGRFGPSAAYNVRFPKNLTVPRVVPLSIVHTVDPIGPGAVDRFTVAIAAAGSDSNTYDFDVAVKSADTKLTWPETFTVTILGQGLATRDTGPPTGPSETQAPQGPVAP